MKKFLSIILAVAMIILPVGAVSCFADGGNDGQSVFDVLRKCEIGKTRADIVLINDGRYFAQMSFFGEDDQYLGAKEASQESYRRVRRTLIALGIGEKIRELGCNKAHVICENYVGGCYSIIINFYDYEGVIVKTLKKEGYNREMELGI